MKGKTMNNDNMNSVLTMNLEEASRAVVACLLADVPVMMWGMCGDGKSSIMKQIAARLSWNLYDVRVSDKEPCDFGAPHPNPDTGLLEYYISEIIPFEKVLENRNGDVEEKGLLFLDEIDRPDAPSMRNVSLQLLLDREMNGHKLGKNVRVVCAGNGSLDDGTIEMTVAQRSRICHIYINQNDEGGLQSWEKWAADNGISQAMRSFARFRHDVWSPEAPEFEDYAIKTRRSWDNADRIAIACDEAEFKTADILPALIAGCVGQADAPVFLSFRRAFDRMPDLTAIFTDPEPVTVPDDPDVLVAIAASLGELFNDDKARNESIIRYAVRLPEEITMFVILKGQETHPAIAAMPIVSEWMNAHKNIAQ